jgi:hypothetical protein
VHKRGDFYDFAGAAAKRDPAHHVINRFLGNRVEDVERVQRDDSAIQSFRAPQSARFWLVPKSRTRIRLADLYPTEGASCQLLSKSTQVTNTCQPPTPDLSATQK